MAIDFDTIFNSLLQGIEAIAKNSLQDFEAEAKADGQQVLENMKLDLQRWTQEIETGAITKEDLQYLLLEDENLAKMIALKQAGLAEVHIDEFRNSIINLITGTIVGLIKV